jgi:hypothetical protein
MDQLRNILQILKKHLFWLLCLACVVCGMLGWKMASGKLAGEYTKKKSEITGKFSALATIATTENFPNSKWKEEIDKITADQKAKVRQAWKQVYDEQAKLLAWPEYLGKDFASRIKKTPEGTLDMDQAERERYMTMIPREYEKLVALVGAKPVVEANPTAPETPRAPPPGQPGEEPQEDRVAWDEASQKKVVDTVKFPDGTPSAQMVVLTQEDLWVYQVLLTIVKNVNTGAIVPPIKKIDQLLIGKEAADAQATGTASGKIEVPQDGDAAAPTDGGQQPAPEPQPGDQKPAPDEGRYVDAEGKALSAASIGDAPYKRMPVFMKLMINQNKIDKLLVECANSPLPVEITQWRVNPGAKDSSQGSPATYRGSGSGSDGPEINPNDVPIELSGIIYIYNPPDPAKLGPDPSEAGAPATAAAGGQ